MTGKYVQHNYVSMKFTKPRRNNKLRAEHWYRILHRFQMGLWTAYKWNRSVFEN